MTFEELTKKRRKWVEANRENAFDEGIKELLAKQYPDNAHFIYELLQNAEDTEATEVCFTLKKKGIEFNHNGRPFSIGDVDSITGIGKSHKEGDPTSIGKFGVGFKAVFAYTNNPEIISGDFHFRISDLVVPHKEGLSRRRVQKEETYFFFPFGNESESAKKACEEIERGLRELSETSLLFLNSIQKINYLLPDSTSGFLERKEGGKDRVEIAVKGPEESRPKLSVFLRFNKDVEVVDEDGRNTPCRIAIAFALEKVKNASAKTAAGWRIKSLKKGEVCIYFPAAKETSNLHFHLHAPFASTIARASVRDCEPNNKLRDRLADLIAESMTAIREHGFLTLGFLATLPNDKDDRNEFNEPIISRLKEEFRKENLIPMKRRGHSNANAALRGSAQLSNLITDKDLAKILDENSRWIANPPQRNQREDNFLSMLDIQEWTCEDLVDELPKSPDYIPEWLREKESEWHQRLYALLGSEDMLNCEDLCIVLLNNGKYSKGSDCYFPDEDVEREDEMPKVAKSVYSSGRDKKQKKAARDFLESIDVREVGEKEKIEMLLAKKYSDDDNSFDPDIKDIKRFVDFCSKDIDTCESLFKDYYIFKSNDEKWNKPTGIYLDSPFCETGLAAYHEDEENDDQGQRCKLSEEYANHKVCGVPLDKIVEFAKKVGVQTKLEPKKQSVAFGHPEELRHGFRALERSDTRTDEDYDIQEFDLLLKKPSIEKAKLVWSTMCNLEPGFLKARYCPNRTEENRGAMKNGSSTLVHKLKDYEWVPQKQDGEEKCIFVKPADADSRNLPEGFPYDSGLQWLKDIEFAGTERREQTAESEQKEILEKALGLPAEEVREMVKLRKEYPEEFEKLRRKLKSKVKREKSSYGPKKSQDPERRKERLRKLIQEAPTRKTGQTTISITNKELVREYLKSLYTEDDGNMYCQVCDQEMPFKKKNDEYYFETIPLINTEKKLTEIYIALCPTCAAKFVEYEGRQQVPANFSDIDGCHKLLLKLDVEERILFKESHWEDIKTILEVLNEERDG